MKDSDVREMFVKWMKATMWSANGGYGRDPIVTGQQIGRAHV